MLELTAYFDESGHSDDPKCRFVGIGGLCAPLDNWVSFDQKWQAILDEKCDGVPFHMNKFARGEEPFNDWRKARKDDLLGALVRTIKSAEAKPFGAVVSLDAYELLCKLLPGADEIIGNPYYLCFQDATSGLSQ